MKVFVGKHQGQPLEKTQFDQKSHQIFLGW